MVDMNSFFRNKKIAVMAPHTDDGEFGAGGSIARIIQEGGDVLYVAYSAAEESLPKELNRNTLKIEVKNATNRLGIASNNLLIFDYKVRRFNEARQAILDDMIRINKEYKPDIVFVPSSNDTHQDHEVISNESFRAFKKITILGYELPWNNMNFPTDLFIKLSRENIDSKIQSIKMYESQKERIYSNPDVMIALALTRGTQIGAKYAEAFEIIRIVL